MEEWKEVEGWNGKYKVSTLGRVWNTITDVEVAQVIAGIPQYLYVNLNSGGRYKLERLHRVVAKAFCLNENPELFDVVDHIDRDKFNNTAANLRWTDNAGNGRNLENNLYMQGVFLKDFVKKYDNPDAAYTHMSSSMCKDELTEEEALTKYELFLEHGARYKKVVWEGEEVLLNELCNRLNSDYHLVRDRLTNGWDIWNAVYGIRSDWAVSFEVYDSKGVGHWYKNGEVFERHHPSCIGVWRRLKDEGKLLEEILAYDGMDHRRQTVAGVTGLIDELCKHFNKTRSNVDTRMCKGMTLEQALLSPPERVKKVTIDGVSGSPKYWYEHYGLVYKTVKRKKDTLKCSFEYILKHFGVDLSGKVISYTD